MERLERLGGRGVALAVRLRVLLLVGATVLATACAPAGPTPAEDPAAVDTRASGAVAPASGAEDPSTVGSPSPSTSGSARPSAASSPPTAGPPSPPPSPSPRPAVPAWTVTNVVDGDTIDVRSSTGSEERVRVIGIDTPERGECGFGDASAALSELVLGEDVTLTPGARDDRDDYDRILRYVDVGGTDAGLALIEAGLAIARYDSRDGYGRHPRQDAYVAADAAAGDVSCAAPAPATSPAPAPAPASEPAASQPPATSPNPWGTASCHPGYDPCVPPPAETGDLNCPDIRRHYPGGVDVDHAHGDPHRLDGDADGHGCD